MSVESIMGKIANEDSISMDDVKTLEKAANNGSHRAQHYCIEGVDLVKIKGRNDIKFAGWLHELDDASEVIYKPNYVS